MEILFYITLTHLTIGFLCSLYFAYLAIQEDSFEYEEFIICLKLTALGIISLVLITYLLINFDDSSEHEDYGHIDDSQEH